MDYANIRIEIKEKIMDWRLMIFFIYHKALNDRFRGSDLRIPAGPLYFTKIISPMLTTDTSKVRHGRSAKIGFFSS